MKLRIRYKNQTKLFGVPEETNENTTVVDIRAAIVQLFGGIGLVCFCLRIAEIYLITLEYSHLNDSTIT